MHYNNDNPTCAYKSSKKENRLSKKKKKKNFYCLKFNENKWLTLLAQTKEDRCISDVLHIPKGPTTAFHSIKSI